MSAVSANLSAIVVICGYWKFERRLCGLWNWNKLHFRVMHICCNAWCVRVANKLETSLVVWMISYQCSIASSRYDGVRLKHRTHTFVVIHDSYCSVLLWDVADRSTFW